MLDQLKKLVQENAQEAIFNNPSVPDEKNEEAVNAASGSIMEVLKNKISSGNIKELLSGGQGAGAEVLKNDITQNFSGKLESLGIGGGSAKAVASSLIPLVVSKLFNKGGSGASSLDITQVIGSLSDGKFDLSSLTGLLGGGNSKGGDKQGGILGKVKDLL